jgi:hypothetical protein
MNIRRKINIYNQKCYEYSGSTFRREESGRDGKFCAIFFRDIIFCEKKLRKFSRQFPTRRKVGP